MPDLDILQETKDCSGTTHLLPELQTSSPILLGLTDSSRLLCIEEGIPSQMTCSHQLGMPCS